MIEVLCTSPEHPIWPRLEAWVDYHKARLVSSSADLKGGEILFLVSCSEIVPREVRDRYEHTFTLHASDLPKGRGWHPQVWAVLEGREFICMSMIEAADPVDTGDIWYQEWVYLEDHELYDELNAKLFAAELRAMDWAIGHAGHRHSRPQEGVPSRYRRRTPEDSRLDPDKTIAEQFDLLRVCDPERFPAFLEIRDHRYNLTLVKA